MATIDVSRELRHQLQGKNDLAAHFAMKLVAWVWEPRSAGGADEFSLMT